MSALVQPRLVNGPFDDPGVYLEFRHSRRAMLFDLGELGGLSPRELLRVTHGFVSHAHMDHLAGLDRLLRTCLHRPGALALVGPPGFVDRVEHRLGSYVWNLLDEDSVDFRLEVSEFDGDRLSRAAAFHARLGFARQELLPAALARGTVLAEPDFVVEAAVLDHGIPSLAFALRERVRVNVWRTALDELGLPVGRWLTGAKRAARGGLPDAHQVEVPGHGNLSLRFLRERVFRLARGQVVAYVTDAADTPVNRDRIVRLAEAADHLFIEATFLEQDRALAEATRHLTARAAGELARAAGVARVTPFHHSARYLAQRRALVRELGAAFGQEPAVRREP
jgi:ribonuclease BN (tRNA processing enzyme)